MLRVTSYTPQSRLLRFGAAIAGLDPWDFTGSTGVTHQAFQRDLTNDFNLDGATSLFQAVIG